MGSATTEIVFDCDLFRIYSDGRVQRDAGMQTVPAGVDAATGVTSKDVVLDAATGVATRLYLPPTQHATEKLPVLVVVHGGYFVVGSPRHPDFHRYVNSVVARARVVAVSVDYRLAPEHPLPAAYDDARAVLAWALSPGADPWLSAHGDLARVFLAGASAGANIAHNVAVAAGVTGLLPRPSSSLVDPPPRIEGVLLLHPSFAGEKKLEEERHEFWLTNNRRWGAIFPGATGGADDPRINPMAADAPSLAKLVGERMLVCTASEDPRAPRGRAYSEAVAASGWPGKVEWFESKGQGHVFFVFDHGSQEAVALMDRVVRFLAGHDHLI
ncbi:hypothetical protein U9M48_014596 [Paspalum notatum var. saurae]|uniref:Alpha/beta hydrolase fold-3 domain-containing protein n=1 Tax=Paspalum notatum var. saurae TaxID=547442 RepID=A0AAQ3WKM5_PASNO